MSLFSLGVVGISLYGFCYYQNNIIDISEHEFNLKINNKIRILQISDLHSKEFGKNNIRLINSILKERPDIVLVTGDLIDSNMKRIDKIIEFLGIINKNIPVYYIPGNNEMRCKRLNEILYKINNIGVTILKNRIKTIQVNGNSINILGIVENRIDDGELFYQKAKSKYKYKESDELLNKLEKMKGIKIVLSHYPENFETNDQFSYNRYGFDIMFSGHAHGGQFILPLVGGLFAPGQGVLPKYYSGVYGSKNKLIVSRGLGNSGFPLRLFNRPNLIVVDII